MPAHFEKNRHNNKIAKLALAAIALISFSLKAEAAQANVGINNDLGSFVLEISSFQYPQHLAAISPAIKTEEVPVTVNTPVSTMTIPLTPQQVAVDMVSPTMYQQWYKVHECEEPEVYDGTQLVSGGWDVMGDVSSGGLGILNSNWIKYGGAFFAPSGNLASPKAQMIIASRIQPKPPDQDGCSPDGW